MGYQLNYYYDNFLILLRPIFKYENDMQTIECNGVFHKNGKDTVVRRIAVKHKFVMINDQAYFK